MTALRIGLRGLGLGLATAVWFAVFALWFLPWPSQRRRGHCRDCVVHHWSRWVLRIAGVRVQLEGQPPAGGGLLVANHLSYLDIPVLASVRPVSFLSKAEVAHWPILGLLVRAVGVQLVRREDKRSLPQVAERLADEVARGHLVLFFPEGTSTSGDALLPFRPALLAPAAATQLPVHHVALRYGTPAGLPPAREAVCWWGDMGFGPHALRLLGLPRIDARVRFGREAVVRGERKELARVLQEGVAGDLAAMG
jgi:1-acyl-sn-glycerol-3-phosphate acyltransferase